MSHFLTKTSNFRNFCIFIILILIVRQTDTILLGSLQKSSLEKPTPLEYERLVGTYYYTWYGGVQHWWEGYTNTPKLGRYSSWYTGTANQHIRWAADNGIDFFAISWLGPNSWEENALKQGFLQAKNLNYIKFCMFYETEIRIQSSSSKTFIDDVKYIAKEYFNNPQYLKIDGKPVLVLYSINTLYLSLGEEALTTVQQVRKELLDRGFDIYLIADVRGFPVEESRYDKFLSSLDAVSWYIFDTRSEWDSLLDSVNSTAKRWLEYTRSKNMDFVPSVFPGFDKTDSKLNVGQPTLDRNVERFADFCEIAVNYSAESVNVVLVSTWNEWHEGTTIEPSEEYGFNYLQVVRDVLSC